MPMPSRAYASLLLADNLQIRTCIVCVNALTGLCLIATGNVRTNDLTIDQVCQCPHGLMPHCYLTDNYYLINVCQCPHGLMPHCYSRLCINTMAWQTSVNALTGLCLIATVPLQKSRFYAVSRACFCRYLSEYSDSSSFSCMFTIWTYFMRQIIPLTLI